jgi:GH15 family glucan-1,4-alpha-glucosidase
MYQYQPIENHGAIGDLNTVALVALDGTIDFMCFPDFDSPTIFAALLDAKRGGFFRIAPVRGQYNKKQLYLPDSNILLTRFLSDTGIAEVIDFMPVEESGHEHAVVRALRGVRGEVRLKMVCAPRFDYARATHRIERGEKWLRFVPATEGVALCLRSDTPLRVENGDAVADFTLRAGETAHFVLEQAKDADSPATAPDFVPRGLSETHGFWHSWVGRATYRGRWREIVTRSALVLKLLISRTHGSVVAAPTFGLPEQIGGERNWDYRYAWVRDSAFTVYCLLQLGYTEEAKSFIKWIHKRCASSQNERTVDAPLNLVYRLDGSSHLPEQILPHLEGYMGSKPVRIGNGAVNQLQLDIYGELMDAVYLSDRYSEPVSYDLWNDLVQLTDWVCAHWRTKDESIWEVRTHGREFTFSRLMCWVAIDRAARIAISRSLPAPLDRWLKTRDEIYRELHQHHFSTRRQAFVRYRGGQTMDASTLLMPLVKFISPVDSRWLSTISAIEEDLVSDALVHRYKIEGESPDGLEGPEGTFSLCSFWYVESLARAGQVRKARLCFEKMLSYANHVGLYSEQLGTQGQHLGNFPQALTHLSLISAAYDLDRNLDDPRRTKIPDDRSLLPPAPSFPRVGSV